jgi:hypothetical protein
MNRYRNFQKNVAQQIEKNPGGNDARARQHDPADTRKPTARRGFFLKHRGETGSAQDAAFVFGNAFPAKKTAASRTPRYRFADGMISTTLREKFHC